MQNPVYRRVLVAGLAVTSAIGLAACGDDDDADVDDQIEEGVDDMEEGVDDMSDDMEEGVDDMTEDESG